MSFAFKHSTKMESENHTQDLDLAASGEENNWHGPGNYIDSSKQMQNKVLQEFFFFF